MIAWNNPFNLRPSSQKWQGEGPPYKNYCTFDTPENGIRAGCKNLVNQQKFHNLRTVRGIIEKYAPPSDNNDTEAYIEAVSGEVGIGPDTQTDLEDASVLSSLAIAIIRHENGVQPYAVSMIEQACQAVV